MDPVLELRFGFLCVGVGRTKGCAAEGRRARKRELFVGENMGGDGDGEGWLSFFLKILPNIFFDPLLGVRLLSGRAGEDVGSAPPDEREIAEDAGVCTPSGPPGGGAGCKIMS